MNRLVGLMFAIFVMGCSGVVGSLADVPADCSGDGDCADGNVCACTGVDGMKCVTPERRDIFALRETIEVCDGRDQDCDGQTDEGLSNACGGCTTITETLETSCSTGMLGVCDPGTIQCNGLDATHCVSDKTGTPELCDNVDQDCDGDPRNGCVCSPGTREACYSGLSSEVGVGICRTGFSECSGETPETNLWGTCIGEVTPQTETCDGRDNNCDGMTDEDLANACGGCLPILAVLEDDCMTVELGVCANGHIICDGPEDVQCVRKMNPIEERCNERDDDCDGLDDQIFTDKGNECRTGRGECERLGMFVCTPDGFGVDCNATAGEPIPESCDNRLDDDCDGSINNGCACTTGETQECGLARGICHEGVQECVGGVWGACGGPDYVSPIEREECNGLDDTCDGSTDEGLAPVCCEPDTRRECGIDLGVCERGQETCSAQRAWGTCDGVGPEPEICDGQDQDCDGVNDNNVADRVSVPAGAETSCNVETRECRGLCRLQIERCRLGEYMIVQSAQGPSPETCNSADDNCNGATDEGIGTCCRIGEMRMCGIDALPCSITEQVCREDPVSHGGTWETCRGLEPRLEDELCNNADDDCDSRTDEDFRPPRGNFGTVCTVGRGICENTGVFRCMADGSVTECSVEPLPSGAETCDNRDEDCDGATDNGVTRPCYTGTAITRNVGACHDGVNRCATGVFGAACEGEVRPTASEACNNVDDDCDSVTDGQSESCYTGGAGTRDVGACHGGTRTCTGGVWGSCSGEVVPRTETCDETDDNCDGATDEPETTLWTSGFETDDLSEWTRQTGNVVPTIVSSPVHSGSKAMQCSATWNTGQPGQRCFLERDLRMCTSAFTYDSWVRIATWTQQIGKIHVELIWTTGPMTELYIGAGEGVFQRGAEPSRNFSIIPPFGQNVWIRFTLIRNAVGNLDLRINGANVFTFSDTRRVDGVRIGGRLEGIDDVAFTIAFDDVSVTVP